MERARIANLAARKGYSSEQLALIDAVAPVKIQSRGVFGGFILGVFDKSWKDILGEQKCSLSTCHTSVLSGEEKGVL